jgi:hypothetical protein
MEFVEKTVFEVVEVFQEGKALQVLKELVDQLVNKALLVLKVKMAHKDKEAQLVW